ncbi:hypothetical protein HanIR_Chr09g0418801 [Helianthus annuus]|nr:hypothetical protein HanIR_Chr09g0418801 [Helianthus annuus]
MAKQRGRAARDDKGQTKIATDYDRASQVSGLPVSRSSSCNSEVDRCGVNENWGDTNRLDYFSVTAFDTTEGIVSYGGGSTRTRQTPVGNKESGASNGRSKKIKGKKRIAGKKVEVQRSNQKRASRGGGGGEVGGVGALQWWKKCWLALICKGV